MEETRETAGGEVEGSGDFLCAINTVARGRTTYRVSDREHPLDARGRSIRLAARLHMLEHLGDKILHVQWACPKRTTNLRSLARGPHAARRTWNLPPHSPQRSPTSGGGPDATW